MDALVEVDGSHGEGGGQVLRLAVALSAATGRPTRVRRVRENRERPGLAAQHAAAVRAVAGLCGARTEGVEVGSREVLFEPTASPGGDARVDVGTAGSVALVLQSALAALGRPSEGPASVAATGGTDVMRAPCWDYLVHVVAPALARAGMDLELVCERRGFHPVGGGSVLARVGARQDALSPLVPSASGRARVEGAIVWSQLPDHVPARIDHAVRRALVGHDIARIQKTRVESASPGVVCALWADLGGAVVGTGMCGRRGLPSEEIGDALGRELRSDLEAGATVDVHLLDQLVPYAALAGGRSVLRAREVSSHARTALDIAGMFVPLRVDIEERDGLSSVSIEPG